MKHTFSQFATVELTRFELNCYDMSERFMKELYGDTKASICHRIERWTIRTKGEVVEFVCVLTRASMQVRIGVTKQHQASCGMLIENCWELFKLSGKDTVI